MISYASKAPCALCDYKILTVKSDENTHAINVNLVDLTSNERIMIPHTGRSRVTVCRFINQEAISIGFRHFYKIGWGDGFHSP